MKLYKVHFSSLKENIMGARIPRSIREQVIKQWLEGISRDRIAKDNGIGAGTVSSIIKDSMQEITDIDLLRAVALIVKRHELNLPLLASSIRLKKKMDKKDLREEEVDSLIENIDTYCFKRRLTAEQFVNIIDSIFDLLKNLAIPLDKLPDYIMQKELERIKGEEEVKDIEMKKHQVLQHYINYG